MNARFSAVIAALLLVTLIGSGCRDRDSGRFYHDARDLGDSPFRHLIPVPKDPSLDSGDYYHDDQTNISIAFRLHSNANGFVRCRVVFTNHSDKEKTIHPKTIGLHSVRVGMEDGRWQKFEVGIPYPDGTPVVLRPNETHEEPIDIPWKLIKNRQDAKTVQISFNRWLLLLWAKNSPDDVYREPTSVRLTLNL